MKELLNVPLLWLTLVAMPGVGADEALKQRVESKLGASRGDISVEVRGGTVVLEGSVPTLEASRKAEKAARGVAPRVDNSLVVSPPTPRVDLEVRKAITRNILSDPYYTLFDSVEVGVKDGHVLLAGSVQQPYRRSDIENRVAAIPGVLSIEDKVAVQRVSTFDDQLRRELARAIYRNALFDRYAFWPSPPVHIVVDGGRVELTGVVGSRVEQVALGHIARQTLAFSVVNRVTVEGETPGEDRKI